METPLGLNINGYSLFVQHFADNLYHLNILDPEGHIHHFEGVYSSRQAAIAKGKSVIENFIFCHRLTRQTKSNSTPD